MDHEVLPGYRPEEHIEVAAGQPEALRAGLGDLDVVSCRDGASDLVDGALQVPVLRRVRL